MSAWGWNWEHPVHLLLGLMRQPGFGHSQNPSKLHWDKLVKKNSRQDIEQNRWPFQLSNQINFFSKSHWAEYKHSFERHKKPLQYIATTALYHLILLNILHSGFLEYISFCQQWQHLIYSRTNILSGWFFKYSWEIFPSFFNVHYLYLHLNCPNELFPPAEDT